MPQIFEIWSVSKQYTWALNIDPRDNNAVPKLPAKNHLGQQCFVWYLINQHNDTLNPCLAQPGFYDVPNPYTSGWIEAQITTQC